MTDFLGVNAHRPKVHVTKNRLSILRLYSEIQALCTICTIYPAAGSKNLSCWELSWNEDLEGLRS